MHIVGVVGTAKNTGKTTTIAALLRAGAGEGLRVALTGIGYDGEEIDTVTSLPKPRLYLERDIVVATSERCLETSGAAFERLRTTPFRTPLGIVSIVRITSPGLLVIAGPNKRTDLDALTQLVAELSPDLLLIDGSLNRLAPLADAEKLIFTTGASRSTELRQLAEEMRAIEAIITLPDGMGEREGAASVVDSLLDKDDAAQLIAAASGGATNIRIRGMLSAAALTALSSKMDPLRNDLTLLVNSPVTLLLAGEPLTTAGVIGEAMSRGVNVHCIRGITLAGVTINPFYPRFHQQYYSPAYVDKSEMLREMQSRLSSPVFNIKDDGAGELLRRCLI